MDLVVTCEVQIQIEDCFDLKDAVSCQSRDIAL